MATDFFKIGQATGQQFTDVSGAVQRGLEAGLKPFAEYEKSRKERVEALGRILQTTPNLDELPKIPAQYSPKISEWASNAKNEYADAARTLVQTSADSAEYREAVQKINNIKTAFANLDNQLNGIREERIEYLDDYQNDRISAGYINGDLEQAYGQNGSITEIDSNGNVSLSGADNKSFKWNERQEHFPKSGEVAKQWNTLGESAIKIGLSGQEKDLSYFVEKSRLAIGTYDLPLIKSLVFDDLDGQDIKLDESIEGIDNPKEVLNILSAPPNKEGMQRLKDIIAQKTGRALFDVYQKNKSQYNKKLQANTGDKSPSSQKAQQSAIDIFNTIIQDPVAYAKTKLRGNFKEGKGNIITLVIDDEDKRFDLKKGDQFMEFMDIVTKNSNQLTGTAAATQEANREFYKITLSAKDMLDERQEGFERMQQKYLPQFFAPETLSDLPTTFN